MKADMSVFTRPGRPPKTCISCIFIYSDIFIHILLIYFPLVSYSLNTSFCQMKGLNFAHINCRSLYKKLSQVDLLFKDYDILCCSETWLTSEYTDAFVEIRDKRIFRTDRNTRGGGVCIYVKSSLAPYCEYCRPASFCNKDIEMVTININKPGLKHMLITSV